MIDQKRMNRRMYYRNHPAQAMLMIVALIGIGAVGLAVVLGIAWQVFRVVAGL